MKISINIKPLKSAHKDRGIGYYTNNLVENLKKDESLEIQEFTEFNEVKDADLIHYPWFDFYFHTLPLRRKIKTVVTIHDVIPLIYPAHYPAGFKGKINFYLQKLALRSVDVIITDSVTAKKDIIKYLKPKDELIHPILLAADEDFKILPDSRLISIKRKFNLTDQFLLFVGDANWVKNLPFLIEGFSKLKKNPLLNNLKLVMVGGVFLKRVENIDHPELESIKKVNSLIKDLQLDQEIIRPGRLEKNDLVALYNLATLYVQPSFYEGFGLPVLEALSCGTPVICSNTGSLKEVGGEAAIYFDPKNMTQFVRVAEEVLMSHSLQKKLSKLSLKQAAKFSWDKVGRETIEVYKRVLDVKKD